MANLSQEERIAQLEQTVNSLNEMIKVMRRQQILMEVGTELDGLMTQAILATHPDLERLEKVWRFTATGMAGNILERYRDQMTYVNGEKDSQLNALVEDLVEKRVTKLDISSINIWKEIKKHPE